MAVTTRNGEISITCFMGSISLWGVSCGNLRVCLSNRRSESPLKTVLFCYGRQANLANRKEDLMLEKYFSAPKTLARLRAGLSGPHIDGFAETLEREGYSHGAALRYLRSGPSRTVSKTKARNSVRHRCKDVGRFSPTSATLSLSPIEWRQSEPPCIFWREAFSGLFIPHRY